MTASQLVVFTIGPVQSFIASARKIEDFWSGSYLLSHLIREALRELYKEEDKFELVFPVITKEELEHPNHETLHIASLPNRFTAIMKGEEKQVTTRLKQIEMQVRNVFYEICEASLIKLFPRLNEEKRSYILEMTKMQVNAFLEIYWVSEPYENKSEFKVIREKLESRLGALKNNKYYPQVEQYGLTCSVCHERDALCSVPIKENDRYRDMKRKLFATWNERSHRYKDGDHPRIKDNEFLCGICTGKRLARDYFREYFHRPYAFQYFESVVEIAGDQKYYAILMMDGDNMGKWFTGDNAENYSRVSKKLASFAMETVPRIIEKEFQGRLVYAGGDDVLAFIPVNQSLQAADKLRFAFSNNKEGLGDEATASAGLIIAHKTAPLQGLLNEVRKLERKAKNYRNTQTTKNALAIGVHTRSGEISEAVLPWVMEDGHSVEVLKNIIDLLSNDLSSTFIYHFTEAFSPLIRLDEKEYEKLKSREMVEVELRRLLLRSAKEQLSEKKLEKVVGQLVNLHDCVPTTMDFLFLLKMLTFFNRKEDKD